MDGRRVQTKAKERALLVSIGLGAASVGTKGALFEDKATLSFSLKAFSLKGRQNANTLQGWRD
ncbi:hypothetical protein ACYX7E_04485 [Luteimonas sp. RIT-PG2_3]